VPVAEPPGLDVRLAHELIEQARQTGVSLVGPDGLLAGVTRTVLQTALDTGEACRERLRPAVAGGKRAGHRWSLPTTDRLPPQRVCRPRALAHRTSPGRSSPSPTTVGEPASRACGVPPPCRGRRGAGSGGSNRTRSPRPRFLDGSGSSSRGWGPTSRTGRVARAERDRALGTAAAWRAATVHPAPVARTGRIASWALGTREQRRGTARRTPTSLATSAWTPTRPSRGRRCGWAGQLSYMGWLLQSSSGSKWGQEIQIARPRSAVTTGHVRAEGVGHPGRIEVFEGLIRELSRPIAHRPGIQLTCRALRNSAAGTAIAPPRAVSD
jgi:hypothetical protein